MSDPLSSYNEVFLAVCLAMKLKIALPLIAQQNVATPTR